MKVFPALIACTVFFLAAPPCQAEQSVCRQGQSTATYGTELLVLKTEMEKNIALCAGSPEFHFNYGYLLERLGKYDKALSQYKIALELEPEDANYDIGIADVLRVKGDTKGAIHHYQQALAKGSTSSRARYNLIKLGGEVQPHAGKSWNTPGAQLASLGEPVALPSHLRATKATTGVPAMLPPPLTSTAKGPGPVAAINDVDRGREKSDMVRYTTFYIDRQEVSIAQYQEVSPQYTAPPGFSPDMPAVNISYGEAQNFADAVGKRLCSADEWRQVVASESPDLAKMNLYKDYYSTPYSTAFGADKENSKNLIGNVAEWVQDSRTPGFIGGHYHSASFLQADLEQLKHVVSEEGLEGKPYVGIRCCRDAK